MNAQNAANTLTCEETVDSFRLYLEGELAAERTVAFLQHLKQCASCKQQFDEEKQVVALLGKAFEGKKISEEFDNGADRRLMALHRTPAAAGVAKAESTTFMVEEEEIEKRGLAASIGERLGAAPWWGVSLVMHVLVIALAGLISMAVKLPEGEAPVIMVTELAPRPKVVEAEVEKQRPTASALASKSETPPTDPTSKQFSEVIVPPEILAKAELGDHFETINPDRPDTQSAFGNPEARMFHSVQGNDEPEGGGGVGGTSLEDMIGVGGAGSPGSGGGWGGGNGTGIGAGNGSGRGSFGNRSGGGRRLMVMRHGGSPATENCVDKGLAWLARHQEADGSWAAEKYADNVIGARHGGGGAATVKSNTVGVSGLAILAFLGAGHSMKIGKYKENVIRGVNWLIRNQAADGHLAGSGCSISTSYCHHIATLALAEAYAMSAPARISSYEDEGKGAKGDLGKAVEKAIELIFKWQDQNPQGGWSYGPSSPIDPTVSGWAVMALKASKVAGFKIPAERFAKALEAIASITTIDATKGDYGHAITGYRGKGAISFGSKGYACTAAGMITNLFLGVEVHDPKVQAALGTITQEDALPAWIFKPQDPSTDHQNLYYWYYGTLGCFQAGGDTWKKWNTKMKDALVPHQIKGGVLDGSPQDRDGSWDPDDVWGAWGGRVYSTALATLSLEVYYRYVKMAAEGK